MLIYKISNLINNKCYIGKTTRTIIRRWHAHERSAKKYLLKKKKRSHLYQAMNYYGINNFVIEQIDSADNEDELNKKEMYWINHFNSTNTEFGYNLTPGGTGGDTWKYSKNKDERRNKIISKISGENNYIHKRWNGHIPKSQRDAISNTLKKTSTFVTNNPGKNFLAEVLIENKKIITIKSPKDWILKTMHVPLSDYSNVRNWSKRHLNDDQIHPVYKFKILKIWRSK